MTTITGHYFCRKQQRKQTCLLFVQSNWAQGFLKPRRLNHPNLQSHFDVRMWPDTFASKICGFCHSVFGLPRWRSGQFLEHTTVIWFHSHHGGFVIHQIKFLSELNFCKECAFGFLSEHWWHSPMMTDSGWLHSTQNKSIWISSISKIWWSTSRINILYYGSKCTKT